MDMEYKLQLAQLRDTVWIHASDGVTVGRFGKFGIDIHNSMEVQLETGVQCLLCTHRPVTINDWRIFREKANELWSIDIPHNAFSIKLLKSNTNIQTRKEII